MFAENTLSMKKILFEYVPLFFAFIGIILCSIIFKQMFIKTLPVCVSLVVMLLSARADRWCFILGSINSVIYIIGYVMEGIYGRDSLSHLHLGVLDLGVSGCVSSCASQ